MNRWSITTVKSDRFSRDPPSKNNQTNLPKKGKPLDEIVAAEPTADYDAKCVGFVINDSSLTPLVYAGA